MKKQTKAREFWIYPELGQTFSNKPFESDYVRYTHVIEYSAYLALKSKYERAVEALEFYADSNGAKDNELMPNGLLILGKRARQTLKDLGEE